MSADVGEVRLERLGAIARIVIDRQAKRNAVTPEMSGQFFEIAEVVNEDDAIRVVVLTGAGKQAFCAGTDVKMLDRYPTPWAFRNRKDYAKAVWAIRKPVIAAISGFALGGGLEIALHSDIRIAGRSAVFGAGEIKLGWHAGDTLLMLPRLIGYGEALKLLLTGAHIDAEEAHRIRLIQELCDDADLESRSMALAEAIARNAPIAAQATKHLVRMGMGGSIEAGMAWQADLQALCLSTDDAREGIQAFSKKRPADFKGR